VSEVEGRWVGEIEGEGGVLGVPLRVGVCRRHLRNVAGAEGWVEVMRRSGEGADNAKSGSFMRIEKVKAV